jgi:hypothetical protein
MSTKKPVADPDIEPEYDFSASVPNPYAERYREDHVPVVRGRIVTDEDLDRMAVEAEAGFDLSTWTPRRGRPPLDIESAGGHAPRLATRVPQRLHDDVVRLAAEDGVSVSEVMRGLLEGYVRGRSTRAATSAPRAPR